MEREDFTGLLPVGAATVTDAIARRRRRPCAGEAPAPPVPLEPAMSDISFSARLGEIFNGVHRRPEVAAFLAREADQKARAIADQRKAVADCAADRACAREMRQAGMPESAIEDAVRQAGRDRALLAGQEQVHALLMDLAELRALMP